MPNSCIILVFLKKPAGFRTPFESRRLRRTPVRGFPAAKKESARAVPKPQAGLFPEFGI